MGLASVLGLMVGLPLRLFDLFIGVDGCERC